jgi:translation initiation factor 1
MKNNDWKDRLGVVFSTNPDFSYEDDSLEQNDTLPPQQQKLRLRIEKNGRGGKTVTIVSGFVGNEEDLKQLARLIKTRCGVGGSSKQGEIIIQGDFKSRIIEILKQEGYSNTK